jgi:hypothetical protein
MDLRDVTSIPFSVDRPLDLGGELQEQPIIGLARLRLDAEWQTVVVGRQR